MGSDELSKSEIEQQDRVDNAIFNLFRDLGLVMTVVDDWDIQKISAVRQAIEEAFSMTETERYQFYPWIT